MHDHVLEARPATINYELLYQQYSKPMYNTCRRIVNNTADAEDILQESFIDAFRQIDKLENKAAFGGWLKRIVINKSINKVSRRHVNWVDIDSYAYSIVEEESVDEAEFVFKVAEIKKAIQQLPDGYRTVLCLRLLEDYKHEEVAEILKISSSTARTQYTRAKRKLLQIIKQNCLS